MSNTRGFCSMEWLKYQVGTRPLLKPLQWLREAYELNKGSKKQSFAQHGEDVFLIDLFKAHNYRGNYVDIGANHPFIINNTYRLYKEYGWRGINIEPNKYLWKRLQYFRPGDVNLNIGIGSQTGKLLYYHLWPSVLSTFSPESCMESLDEGKKLVDVYPVEIRDAMFLLQYLTAKDGTIALDLLSVDTEGYELEILKGIDFDKLRPKVILIENAGHGLTDSATLRRHLESARYVLLKRIGCNDCYVDSGQSDLLAAGGLID